MPVVVDVAADIAARVPAVGFPATGMEAGTDPECASAGVGAGVGAGATARAACPPEAAGEVRDATGPVPGTGFEVALRFVPVFVVLAVFCCSSAMRARPR